MFNKYTANGLSYDKSDTYVDYDNYENGMKCFISGCAILGKLGTVALFLKIIK